MSKINYTSLYLTKHSRDFYRGQSIHYSGKWTIGSHYIYDNYEIDFVVHNNVLLACSKSHLANIDNKPTDFIYDERGTVIGINSDYWDFVLAGIIGKEGKIYLPSYDKDTGVLTWHLISKDEAEEESTGGEIPMSLAGLKDDENHRVVTDTQISSWEKVVSDLSDFIEDSPFRKGTGTDSAVLKVNIAENIALGLGSVAEGVQTKAIGNGSHTEGLGTIANNGAEHAFGVYNKSNKASDTFYSAGNTLFSIGMGFGEDSRENAVEVMQNSDVYLRGIGDYDGTNPEDAKTLKEVIDSKADSADLNDYVTKINNPFAVGSGIQSAFQKNPEHPNTASGNSSVAIGADNEATKIGSFAANRKNHAIGDDSNATGYGNTASGDTSHAEGSYTTASGTSSHAEGNHTEASGSYSHAEGWYTQASGVGSHVEGWANYAEDDAELAASGIGSHAEGYAYDGVHMESKGVGSHIEGVGDGHIDRYARGSGSHAEGYNTMTSGSGAHAEGYGSTANNDGAHAEGIDTSAKGSGSHAEGNLSIASGSSSHAEGHSTITQNLAEHAEGRYNRSNTGTRHSVGIGTSNAARKNAFEIMENGDAYLFGIGGYDGTNPESTNTLQQILDSFITKTVSDLTNYYTKSQTYTKEEVMTQITNAIKGSFVVVTLLPTASADTLGKIYLIPSTDAQVQNIKDEYITIESGGAYSWEKIGSTSIDLSGYATEQYVDEKVAAKYTKPVSGVPASDLAAGVIPEEATNAEVDALFE